MVLSIRLELSAILPPTALLNVGANFQTSVEEVGQSPKKCAARLPEKLLAYSFLNLVLAKRIA